MELCTWAVVTSILVFVCKFKLKMSFMPPHKSYIFVKITVFIYFFQPIEC